MIQPTMPNLPGFNAMADTMEFVKNMWGGMKAPASGIPGMIIPTFSVEEINKQISDLKAVESWLNVNMNMLRGTIQALEVQSATISTLRAMGETFAADVKPGTESKPATAAAPFFSASAFEPQPASAAGSDPSPASAPAAWWNMLQDQFNQAVNSVMVEEASATKKKAKPASAAAKSVASKSAAKSSKKRASAAKP